MLFLTFCFISAFAFGLTESQDLQGSKIRHQRPKFYYSYGDHLNKSKKLESQDDLDLWKHDLDTDQNDFDNDGSIDKYFPLNAHETFRSFTPEPETKIFRTRGKGKAFVQRGETVYVPNELSRKKVHKGTITVRVVDGSENDVRVSRHRGGCKECPSDKTVMATKGNSFVILPEPCPLAPRMWNHISGPKPGSKVQAGLHTIRGSIGPKKKPCEFRYQVLVNRCEELKPMQDMTLECSAQNLWGSICIASCGNGKEAVGPTDTECKEDLTWSNPLPTCKSSGDCPSPKIRPKTKISCKTGNRTDDSDYLPNGSICKLRRNGKSIPLICKDGRWVKTRKVQAVTPKENQEMTEPQRNETDVCNPNPCQNGGICLRAEASKGPPICRCPPQTQGLYCELRVCYYNICENDGLCVYQNEERTCYCLQEFSGARCQNYEPR